MFLTARRLFDGRTPEVFSDGVVETSPSASRLRRGPTSGPIPGGAICPATLAHRGAVDRTTSRQ
jgi:hypothetical protein